MADAPLTLKDLAKLDIATIKGVGDKRRESLAEVGIANVLELITTYPRRYVDRTNEAHVGDLVEGVETLVLVKVRSTRRVPLRTKRSMVTALVGDATGSLSLTFFNQPWRERQLKTDLEVAVFGKPELFRGKMQMVNPVVDIIGDKTGRIVPIYPQSEKANLSTWELASWVRNALDRAAPRTISDPLPPQIREGLKMIDRHAALNIIHFPESIVDKERARERLAFDELLRVQLVLVGRKHAFERDNTGIRHDMTGEMQQRFVAALPFPLTGAQRRVIDEVNADLAKPVPMHRLLQGDVGSGKTVVAVAAMLAAVQGGHQGALMAPTEVLAEQHFAGITRLLADLKVPDDGNLFGERQLRVELLTGRITGERRRELLADLASGGVDIAIGTHALIQEGVAFSSLGVVVIDEQHRFGVEQRAALRGKGAGEQHTTPDVLVMTATPIPRTAAMTVYGDLEVSVLDELPPGRTPIATMAVVEHDESGEPSGEAASMWAEVRKALDDGQQAFVVCPMIEESDKLEVAAAEEIYESLSKGELAKYKIGLLHGRMSSNDKDAVMTKFRDRKLMALVSTTVIEVGVDVPNATCMVVLDADRFGIAQLHQLRGRVGRGAIASRCWLVRKNPHVGAERVGALVESTDGFYLAEVDLELRGEGTLMSTAQKGASDLKLASLRRDEPLIRAAREVAFEIIGADPKLKQHRELAGEVNLLLAREEKEFLTKD
ncbi:MAG: ATP-dependent DNA helicase RecG [Ilumatobacteraceae bacterium]|nr:ATP-dependent DNA helicase RecG [Ilumatobacteraceae bacterium]